MSRKPTVPQGKPIIGILNGGGDAPGLNAVTASLVKAGMDTHTFLGFFDSFEGLLNGGDYCVLDKNAVRGISNKGGTILGTRNKGPFSSKIAGGEVSEIDPAIVAECKATLTQLNVEALVVLGGDGTLNTALQLAKGTGVPCIGVPKTIDNDLAATNATFGFQSAVEYVCQALDRLHDTMTAHKRAMVVEIMGRHAGWMALHGGLAGGADIILLPEIPFRYENIINFIAKRNRVQHRAVLIAVAEGAHAEDEEQVRIGNREQGEWRLGGIAEKVATAIEEALPDTEARAVVLGHVQRGGSPVAYDRILAFEFGVKAYELIKEKKWGYMPARMCNEVGEVPIKEAVAKLKRVGPDDGLVHTARAMGVSFGDK